MVKFLLICLDLLLYGIDFAVLLKFMDIQYGKILCLSKAGSFFFCL